MLRLFGLSSIQDKNSSDNKSQPSQPQPTEEKKLKPCCACPETKRARDACIIENGEANCTSLIEAHRECMRKMGFNI